MKTVDAVDGDIRFVANWGGQPRWVFMPVELVEADAARKLSRDEAIEHVRGNLERYTEAAIAQHGPDNTVRMIELKSFS